MGGTARAHSGSRRAATRALVLIFAVSGLVVAGGLPSFAACHAFTVTVSPSSVTEGGKVTATVERDGDLAASNITVSTVAETAKSPGDYEAISEKIEFSGSGSGDLSRTIQISTEDDHVHETNETFRVHLSDPGGCSINPNYDVGPDARVTIKDNDAAPTPTPTKTRSASATAAPKPTATSPSPTPASSVKTSPRASRSVVPTLTPTDTASGLAAGATSGGNGARNAGIAVGVILLLAAGGLLVARNLKRT